MVRATDASKRTTGEVRITEAAPGTTRLHGRLFKVVRGTLLPEFFGVVDTPPYQRELMTANGKHDALIEALGPDGIGIPDDLLLCCRTTEFTSVGAGEIIVPTEVLYTLDGLQRVGAGKARLANGWNTDPFGVKILLGTDLVLEKYLFYQVNRLQTNVATDVHLGNSDDNAACKALRMMAEATEGFPEVKWKQQRGSGEKITAHMLYEVAIMLHGYAQDRPFEGILTALEELTDSIGTERLTNNVQTFFEVVRQCYDGTEVQQYRWRVGMLRGMATLFSTYQDFWKGDQLLVRQPYIKKLRSIKWKEVDEALDQNNAARAIRRALERQLDKGRRSAGLQLREQS